MVTVTIENLPWNEFLLRYDKPETFFYLDPPYYKLPYYQHNLGLEDYQHMSKILSGIQSKFILSLNDHPDITEAFKEFNIKPIGLKYSASKGKQTTGKELLITNY